MVANVNMLCVCVVLVKTDIADWLLQYNVVGRASGQVTSARNVHIHITSFAAYMAVIYSASVVDSATSDCFFELQDTAPPSIVKMYLDIEW